MEENGRAYLVIPAKAGIYRAMGTGLRRCDEDGSLVRQRLFSWEDTEITEQDIHYRTKRRIPSLK